MSIGFWLLIIGLVIAIGFLIVFYASSILSVTLLWVGMGLGILLALVGIFLIIFRKKKPEPKPLPPLPPPPLPIEPTIIREPAPAPYPMNGGNEMSTMMLLQIQDQNRRAEEQARRSEEQIKELEKKLSDQSAVRIPYDQIARPINMAPPPTLQPVQMQRQVQPSPVRGKATRQQLRDAFLNPQVVQQGVQTGGQLVQSGLQAAPALIKAGSKLGKYAKAVKA